MVGATSAHRDRLADVATVSGGTNFVTGVFLYDRSNGAMTELTRKRDGTPGNDYSEGAVVSADGRYVALTTRAPNLIGETSLKHDLSRTISPPCPARHLREQLKGPLGRAKVRQA